MAPVSLLILGSFVTLTLTQSSDPNLGINPNAQGATEDMTPGSGPNGYFTFLAMLPGY
jgi:hypothetical protein